MKSRPIDEQRGMSTDDVKALCLRLIEAIKAIPGMVYTMDGGTFFFTPDRKFTISINPEWHDDFCADAIVYDNLTVMENINRTEGKHLFGCDTVAELQAWLKAQS